MDHHLKSACEHFIQQQTAQFVEPLELFTAKVRAARGFLLRDFLSGGRSGRTGREARVCLSDSVWEITALLSWKLLALDFQIKTAGGDFSF